MEGTAAIDTMQVDTTGIDAQLAVVLSYNGTAFSGYAKQPGKRTVQGNLEQAFSLALRRPVEVVCAGRTDAGVHARGQVVSFPITREEAEGRNLFKLKRSFQALTDDDISIQTLAVMPPDFSARFSAIEREYRYLVMPGGRHPLFLRGWCWDARRELDVDAMNEAASYLVGEHDFKSFCLAASAEGKNTVRALREVRVVPVNVMGEDALSIRVTGTAFLHSMVRSIVGTLVMVGSGLREPAWVKDVLEARDRRAAGENAPACGLVFWRVSYRGGLPCYERDGALELVGVPELARAEGAEAAAELRADGVTRQDVLMAEAAIDALEQAEDDADGVAAPMAPASGKAFSEVALQAPLPKAVEEAANRPGPKGSMRVNEVSGPAIPAAPRTRKIKPADPQPAEGEVSISFEVHRDSAATRAAKAQKEQKAQNKGGMFRRLFGK
ncbi:MAG: tRNA pseudouridine(38-40) synthase TruA [Coriobacteriia bacterium]|nr:tRNA pseudouridine(38-40) synthase TruA [Coriobacteriia bacterium]